MVVGRLGDTLGLNDGFNGEKLGPTLGTFVGDTLGNFDGEKLGPKRGTFVGVSIVSVGSADGTGLGLSLFLDNIPGYSRHCKEYSTHLVTLLVGSCCVVLKKLNELYRADLRWLMEEF